MVLLRQQLRRRHQRGLVAVLQRQQHREQRDHGLARAHVAHQQAMHPLGLGHVLEDFADRLLLVRSQRPGQVLTQLRGQRTMHDEPGAALAVARDLARAGEHQLQVEQFVDREAAATPPRPRWRWSGDARRAARRPATAA